MRHILSIDPKTIAHKQPRTTKEPNHKTKRNPKLTNRRRESTGKPPDSP